VESGGKMDDNLVSRHQSQGLALENALDFDRVSATSTHDRNATSSWQVRVLVRVVVRDLFLFICFLETCDDYF
jgi:hypothetical protein